MMKFAATISDTTKVVLGGDKCIGPGVDTRKLDEDDHHPLLSSPRSFSEVPNDGYVSSARFIVGGACCWMCFPPVPWLVFCGWTCSAHCSWLDVPTVEWEEI